VRLAGSGSTTAERRFFSGMAIFMIVVVLIGFAPSFYFRGLVEYPRPNPAISPLVLLHGLAFSAWMLIFLMQVRLIAHGRRDLHMRLGRLSMAFAASLIPLMIATTIGQVARGNQPPGFTPLGWTAVPAFGIPVFAALIWLGWSRRRDAQAHKRLMLCAALMMMDPAIGRFPLFPPDITGVRLSDLAGWLPFLALIAWDWRTRGRLHWATAFGAGVWGLVLILRGFAITSPWWEGFAGSVVALAGE
jgi:hypothetical protein